MNRNVIKATNKEKRLDNWVSLSLKLGIAVSLALAAIGLILVSLAGTKEIESIVPLNQLLKGIIELKATAIITAGILILMLTPLMPLLIAIATFSTERNKLYLGISIIVLCFLALSLALALI